MKNSENQDSQVMDVMEVETLTFHTFKNSENLLMSYRVCDKCGKSKEVYGGKTCAKGHFICHSCASGHNHCPLCGHTLR